MTLTKAPEAAARVEPVPAVGGVSPRNAQRMHSLGLTSATGLVVGSIVGTGVFTMPEAQC